MLGFCHLLIGLHFHYLLKRKPQCFSEMIKQLNSDVIEYMHIYIERDRTGLQKKAPTYQPDLLKINVGSQGYMRPCLEKKGNENNQKDQVA